MLKVTKFYFKFEPRHQEAQVVCYTAVFRVVTQRFLLWEGALRDDNKNGCVAD